MEEEEMNEVVVEQFKNLLRRVDICERDIRDSNKELSETKEAIQTLMIKHTNEHTKALIEIEQIEPN